MPWARTVRVLVTVASPGGSVTELPAASVVGNRAAVGTTCLPNPGPDQARVSPAPPTFSKYSIRRSWNPAERVRVADYSVGPCRPSLSMINCPSSHSRAPSSEVRKSV